MIRALALIACLAAGPAWAGMDVPQAPPIAVDPSQFDPAGAAAAVQALAPSLAPVQSVNTKTGTVVIPNVCRQQSNTTSLPTTNPASLTWSFPLASNPNGCGFATPPSCWSDISTTSNGSVFDYPLNTARSTSSVTYAYTAHASTVAVVVGGVSIISVGGTSGAPPSGSTVVLTCTAPPA